jgi:hypothetical protein
MSRIDEILAKQTAIEAELKAAMQEERKKELKGIKEKIALFGFTPTELGVRKGKGKKRGRKPASAKK